MGVQISGPGLSFDISCFGLDADERLADDRYFIFFNQPKSPEEAIQQLGAQAGDTDSFRVTLDRIPAHIRKLSFTATVDGAGQMSQTGPGYLRLVAGGTEVARYSFTGAEFSTERAVMLGDIYLKDFWRFAAVGQGFDGGLEALLRNFGGEVLEEEAAPEAAPPGRRRPTPGARARLRAAAAGERAPGLRAPPGSRRPLPRRSRPRRRRPCTTSHPRRAARRPRPPPRRRCTPPRRSPPPHSPARLLRRRLPRGPGPHSARRRPAARPARRAGPARPVRAARRAPPQAYAPQQQPYGMPAPPRPSSSLAPARTAVRRRRAPVTPAHGAAAPGVQGALEKYREAPTGQRWTLQNSKLMRVDLGVDPQPVLARQGSMVLYQGKIDFGYKGAGFMGRIVGSATGQEMQLMRCTGRGQVFLAENSANLHPIQLENDAICVAAESVLAFDESLHYEVRRIEGHGIPGGALFTMQFQGMGTVVVKTHGTPVVLPVTPTTFADSNAIVAWSAGAQVIISSQVRLRRNAYPGHSGEAVNLQFRGAPGNFIVVQPYEV
ncbi:hypothetical protein GCM10020000_27340 [Streptomyces olivoverticillatus]